MSGGHAPAPGAPHGTRVPAATYRLQFHAGFTLRDARARLAYLDRLGVTTCYASPLLAARPASAHGYDLVDPTRLNPDVGGPDDFTAFTDALAARRMTLLLDFVPNHMGIDPAANPWWRDVLENGPSSPFARYFDIDWAPALPELHGKVLLPILGDQYGIALERGDLRLALADGALTLRCAEHDLPVNPRQARLVFERNLVSLEQTLGPDDGHLREFLSILTALRNLPPYTNTDEASIAERHREKEIARERLMRLLEASPAVRGHIEANIVAFNGTPGDASSFDPLHELLEAQAYRLAYWRTAMHEINYRRFFDINDLAGLTMERPEVFDATHALVLEYIGQGRVQGLRLDHVDGLFAPAAYFRRLRDAMRRARGAPGGAAEPYVVVEKILSGAERLPAGWDVDGTTGYDFLNDVNGIFVDGSRAQDVKRIYARFTGRASLPADELYASKTAVMNTSLASELNVLAFELHRISEQDRRSRDFTPESLRDALREIVAAFPVYRTYVSDEGSTPEDARAVETAVARARRRNPATEPSIFDFVRDALLPAERPDAPAGFARRLRFAMKFQQFTGPVQAKGLEDTTFYRYVPLASLNEVEGDLFRFGRSPGEFHEANARRRADWPASMLATATHDTKRGEDARARLNVLSEIPDDWRRAIGRWARLNASQRATVDGVPAPDRHDEYLFYQALLSIWPAGADAAAGAGLTARLQSFMMKAIREAKIHTSWINPYESYERAVADFVDGVVRGRRSDRFLAAFLPLQQRVARAGAMNGLAQLVLKLAAPGVPDIYQGNELWDLHLVDPDNRSPVDFDLRERLLAELWPAIDAARRAAARPRRPARTPGSPICSTTGPTGGSSST
jgi:(1->4)-alpha-D-glucan 1-alpha-D-glucosylmutase